MALNVTTAVFAENCNTATASPSLAQWDTEQVLQISGIELPDSYKVEFSTVYTRNAIPEIGDASGVAIPNELLQRSAPITAYVVLYGENGGRNREYWITIYITPGQPPETITPDPAQADVIDEAIAALNSGVARTEAAAEAAGVSAGEAEAAAEAVQNLSVAAETLATGEPATVEKTVDEETGAVTLNFGLPRGAKGDPLTYEDLTPEQKAELVQGPILEAQDAAVTAVRNARASAVDAVGSAGTTQVNAVNQAGTTQTGAVNQAGANQVAAVNQAGTNQVQAVEDKGAEVLEHIPPDYTDLVDDVADLSRKLNDETTGLDSKAPVILETVSGAIASFSDGANGMPIKKLVAQIEPVQDLHGYDHPWPAGGGKNKLPNNVSPRTYSGITVEVLNDGSVKLSGTATANDSIDIYRNLSAMPDELIGSSVVVSVGNVVDRFEVFVSTNGSSFDTLIASMAQSTSATNTVPSTAVGLLARVYVTSGVTYNTTIYPMIRLVSETDATFAPYSNECPISGWTGLSGARTGGNLADQSKFRNGNYDGNGVWLPSGGDSKSTDFIPVKPNTVYSTAIIDNNNNYLNNLVTVQFDSQYNYVPNSWSSSANITTFINAAFVVARNFASQSDVVGRNSFKYVVVEGENAADYDSQKDEHISVNWQDTAGTVYGGTPDVISGKMVVDRAMVDLGTLTWYEAIAPDRSKRFRASVTGIKRIDDPTTLAPLVCSAYPTKTANQTYVGTLGISLQHNTNDIYIYDPEKESFSVADFKTAMSGVQLVYKLAEPVTYQLTPQEVTTLLGNNVVYTDVGPVSVEYTADTKLYIDNKITQAIAAALNA